MQNTKTKDVLFVAPFDGIPGGIMIWAEHIYNYYQTISQQDITLHKLSIGRTYRVQTGQPVSRIINAIKDYITPIRNYTKILKHRICNVVHISSSASLSLLKDLVMVLIAHRYDVKTVVHFHFGRIPDLKNANNWEWKLLKKVISLSDSVIVMTETSYKVLAECGFKNVAMIPNPLAPKVVSYISNHSNYTRIPNTILFVGHVLKTKGIEELVDACGQFENIKLKIIGYATDDMKIALQRKALDGKRKDTWLELYGELPYNEVLEQMLKCDIFVLPTYTEGFPNVILESMACGCAIITTKVGAIPEILREDYRGKYGILIEPKNTKQLIAAINELLYNETIKQQCRQNVKVRVLEKYSMQIIWNKLSEIWHNL